MLPNINKYEAVLFHKNLHWPSNWLLLQIPMQSKFVKSNTFRLDLQKPTDKAWYKLLPVEEKLTILLSLYGHVVYFPSTRELVPVEDMSVRNEPLMSKLFSTQEVEREGGLGRWSTAKLGMRRSRRSIVL